MRQYLKGLILVALIGAFGCEKKESAEKAGERADEVIDNIKHGDNPLKKKGEMEKLGDSIDESLKTEKND